ncbi:MAG: AEC family transporter [Anaerovoracaceae bacterium]
MNSLTLAFSAVFPLLIMLSVGLTLRLLGIIKEKMIEPINALCFKVFLPFLLFYNIYKSDIGSDFSVKMTLFTIIAFLLLVTFLILFIPRVVRKPQRRGVMVQGIFRSNFILYGIPIAVSIYGDRGAAIAAILIGVIVPTFNFLAVFTLEFFSKDGIKIRDLSLSLIKNPLIISAIMAFTFIAFKIELPQAFETVVADISEIATPLALITLGAAIRFRNAKKNWRAILMASAGKLLIVPTIFLSIAIGIGFRNAELIVLFAVFASPTSVSSFPMAQHMQGDSALAGEIVAFTSVVSLLTIFIGILILKSIAVI